MTTSSITPKLIPITPLELYLRLAAEPYDSVRATNARYSYFPVQFGGPVGQALITNNCSILMLSDFQVT